jgi:hypothetical protein
MKKFKIWNFHVPSLSAKGNPMIRRESEFSTYLGIILGSFGLSFWKSEMELFLKRIMKLYTSQKSRRNLRQVFTYLKEAYLVTYNAYTHGQYEPKIRIRVDKAGFPKIIPSKLRIKFLDRRKLFVACTTLLGLHRLIPWWPDVDYSTILDPFRGQSRTLPMPLLEEAKRSLMQYSSASEGVPFHKRFNYRLRIGRCEALRIEKSGPNGKWNWGNAVEDAFAFYTHPRYLISVLRWLYMTKSFLMMASLCSILIVGFPVWLISGSLSFITDWLLGFSQLWRAYTKCYLALYGKAGLVKSRGRERVPRPSFYNFRLRYHLGKLSVVKNTAGKARIVGMTNYWIQICLYPLHKAIFRFLKTLGTDGTFDQLAPIKELLKDEATWPKFFSFDLSAATDRLPVDVQKQVLTLFTDEKTSHLWTELVKLPFVCPDRGNEEIHYAVGQPMGCYSSWAMLALTHHMIVNAAVASSWQQRWCADHFVARPFYAVLGDDVVLTGYDRDETIPANYLRLMEHLGVDISLPKSLVSDRYLEFAKKVVSRDSIDWSPVGPGLILSVVRNRFVVGIVLADLVNRGLIDFSASLEFLGNLAFSGKRKMRDVLGFAIFTMYGPKGSVSSTIDSHESGMRWLESYSRIPGGLLKTVQFRTLLDVLDKRYWEIYGTSRRNLDSSLEYLSDFAMHKYGRRMGYFYKPLMWLTPFPWLLRMMILRQVWDTVRPNYSDPDELPNVVEEFKELHLDKLESPSLRQQQDYLKLYREIRNIQVRHRTQVILSLPRI